MFISFVESKLMVIGVLVLGACIFSLFTNTVTSIFCDDFMIINTAMESDEGNLVGSIQIKLSEVDSLLRYGLNIMGNLDSEYTKQRIQENIQGKLDKLKLINREFISPIITSKEIIQEYALNEDSKGDWKRNNVEYFLTSRGLNSIQSQWPISSSYETLLPKELLETSSYSSKIRVYQTINAFTGGTTAMRTLATQLQQLEFPIVLCNHTNIADPICNRPQEGDIAITGEWCEPVLEEYLKYSTEDNDRSNVNQFNTFNGRGIQYFLGFHHGRDECRGWVTAADSQFIYTTLAHRGMQAYYLGCVMSEKITSFAERLIKSSQDIYNHNETKCEEIPKEKLILVDGDFFDDYPPHLPVEFSVPTGYQVIILRKFSPEEIILLLQRAQIVLDLAMPGPERISSEGILFGAIPIVASRWNGASTVDFPGLLRVDAHNGSDISSKLQYVSENYQAILQSIRSPTEVVIEQEQPMNLYQFWKYINSMPNRSKHTVDAYFSSMYLHFVLDTSASLPESDNMYHNTLEQEILSMFQTVALLYLYPLASIDIIVEDVLWFYRHHYVFMDYLRQAGYLRIDIMDPREIHLIKSDASDRTSFVRIRLPYTAEGNNVEDRPWPMFHVRITPGFIFANPVDLYTLIRKYITSADKVVNILINTNQEDKTTSLAVVGPKYSSAYILYAAALSNQVISDYNQLDIKAVHICDILDNEQDTQFLVLGVKETIIWQMLATTFVTQLRNSLQC